MLRKALSPWLVALALAACTPPAENCTDGVDNNGDGNVDCNDAECGAALVCTPEVCDNNADDNGDGAFDCDDADCVLSPFCLCGNGQADAGEDCDGADLDGQRCDTVDGNFSSGTLACNADCTFDTSDCSAAFFCGNDIQEGAEQCDRQDLGGQDCTSLGFDRGTLACNANCTFNLLGCVNDGPVCGNGTVEPPEACDDGNNLNGDGCAANCILEGLAQCGDGVINVAGEQCDDGNLISGDGCEPDCTLPECADGIDNDQDGDIDGADLGCASSGDDSEQFFANDCFGVGGPIFDFTLAQPQNTILTVNGALGGGNGALEPSDTSGDCTTAPGAEITFRYSLPVAMTLDVNITSADFDTVLYVREGNCASPVETCNDNTAGTLSRVTRAFPQGDLFITVDSKAGGSGNFVIVLTPQ